MDYRLTIKTGLAILDAKRRDDPRGFAVDAIGRLNGQRTGHPSCDAWIDYAIGQWRAFLSETAALADAQSEG